MSLFKKKKNKFPTKEATSLIRRMISENIGQYKLAYTIAIIASLVSAATNGALAYLMQPMIDKIFVERDASYILIISGAIFGMFLLRGFSGYIQAVQLAVIGNNLVACYQKRILDQLMRLGMDFYADRRSGHLAAQINQNVTGIRDLLNMTISSIARDIISLIGLVGMMFYMEPILSLIVFLIGPPLVLAVAYISRRIRAVTRELVNLNSHLLGAIQESLQGITIVKAFTMEKLMVDKISTLIDQSEERSNKIARVSERTTPISEIIAGFAISGVIAYGGYAAIADNQAPGAMFAFITALMFAYDPARRLARLQVGLERSLVNARMIYEILDIEPQQADKEGAVILQPKKGEISFEKIRFSYQPGQPVLNDVTFTAAAGKVTAIVGASGAGKSTLIGLVQRFYDLDSGKITIDGQNIAHVTKASLRHSIAYVSQQAYLFEGTIGDNIQYGRPDATYDEIVEAAKLAHAHEFIIKLPLGYDTPIGENGTTLSGGQRQRLSIARAIVRNAPILLLDEATSALDNESEKKVQKALENVMRDRTTLVIAHRLSTIIDADTIIVMEAGRVVEKGRHEELIEIQNGVYSRFYELQSGKQDTKDDITLIDDLQG